MVGVVRVVRVKCIIMTGIFYLTQLLTKRLVTITFLAANVSSADAILNSLDVHNTSFIDNLIHAEQKVAIAQYCVQQYLQEIWQVRVYHGTRI